MDQDEGVVIEDGVIHIDHPKIEARLQSLAVRWGMTVEEALERMLDIALEDEELCKSE